MAQATVRCFRLAAALAVAILAALEGHQFAELEQAAEPGSRLAHLAVRPDAGCASAGRGCRDGRRRAKQHGQPFGERCAMGTHRCPQSGSKESPCQAGHPDQARTVVALRTTDEGRIHCSEEAVSAGSGTPRARPPGSPSSRPASGLGCQGDYGTWMPSASGSRGRLLGQTHQCRARHGGRTVGLLRRGPCSCSWGTGGRATMAPVDTRSRVAYPAGPSAREEAMAFHR